VLRGLQVRPYPLTRAQVILLIGGFTVGAFIGSVSRPLLALSASGEPRSFKCKEPLPEFTLGPASNPSDAELAKLCACVWSKLPEGRLGARSLSQDQTR
jgi:hypothetical protein